MKSKINYWQIVYILILIGIVQFIFISLTDLNVTITIKILLGILGTFLGLFIERMVHNRNWIFKLLLLVILIAPPFIIGAFRTNQDYKTCEICGYIAVDSEGFCNSCFCNEWRVEKNSGDFQNHGFWVKEMQLETFVLDSLNQENVFNLTDSDLDFEKDKNWKPSVTLNDLIENFKMQNK